MDELLELPLLWSEESNPFPLIAVVFGVTAAGVAAWVRAVGRIRQNTRTRSWSDYLQALFALHDSVYETIAGAHPWRRPWHHGWLSVKDLYKDFRPLFTAMTGRVLDVGCLGKPYSAWLKKASAHIGVDVQDGPHVDVVIRPGRPWSVDDASFDSVICTQVLQVIRDPHEMLGEIDRVLAPGGLAVFAAPFAYNDMSQPAPSRVYGEDIYKDYGRWTIHGLQEMIASRFEIVEVRRQGGVGSTVGVMFLNWIHISMSKRTSRRLLFVMMMPAWLVLTLLVNVVGWAFDKLDSTGAFYHNVMVIARKRP